MSGSTAAAVDTPQATRAGWVSMADTLPAVLARGLRFTVPRTELPSLGATDEACAEFPGVLAGKTSGAIRDTLPRTAVTSASPRPSFVLKTTLWGEQDPLADGDALRVESREGLSEGSGSHSCP